MSKKEVKKDVKKSTNDEEMKKNQKVEIKEEIKKEEVTVKENEQTEKKDNKKAEAKAKIKESKAKIKQEKEMIKKAKKTTGNNDTKIIVAVIVAVLLVAFSCFGFYFYKANYEAIATFDGGRVTKADYDVYYKTFASMLQYYGYSADEIPTQIAKKAGIDGVIVKLAKDAGTTLSDDDKKEIEEVFSNEDYINTFSSQKIDIARMRKLYNNDYLISAYEDELIKNADNDEVLNYIKKTNGDNVDLTEYNTSHILFKVDSSADDATKEGIIKKAEEVLQRAKNGEDFAELAKEFSEDTGTKDDGGKFTFYSVGNVDEAYEAAAKSLNDGEIYPTLVESSFGYHIIKMDSKVENGRANYTTERQEYVNEYLNSLEEKYNLKINESVLNKYLEKNGISTNTSSTTSTEDATDEVTTEDTTTEDTTSTQN